jgi:hypothetical protein
MEVTVVPGSFVVLVARAVLDVIGAARGAAT